jgi:hypothetical protein
VALRDDAREWRADLRVGELLLLQGQTRFGIGKLRLGSHVLTARRLEITVGDSTGRREPFVALEIPLRHVGRALRRRDRRSRRQGIVRSSMRASNVPFETRLPSSATVCRTVPPICARTVASCAA